MAGYTILSRKSEAPQAAWDALKTIKQLQARTETGVTYTQYVDAVGKAWMEVKPFVESPDGKKYSEFASLLTNIIDQYKAATETWQNQNLTLLYWEEAGLRIIEAKSLLDAQLHRARSWCYGQSRSKLTRLDQNIVNYTTNIHG